jgi:hypothetical protein
MHPRHFSRVAHRPLRDQAQRRAIGRYPDVAKAVSADLDVNSFREYSLVSRCPVRQAVNERQPAEDYITRGGFAVVSTDNARLRVSCRRSSTT